jgi:hypothetical protein
VQRGNHLESSLTISVNFQAFDDFGRALEIDNRARSMTQRRKSAQATLRRLPVISDKTIWIGKHPGDQTEEISQRDTSNAEVDSAAFVHIVVVPRVAHAGKTV